jgi:hypothetical protein
LFILIFIFAILVCSVTPALAQKTQDEAKQMYQWQQGKVVYEKETIRNDVGRFCKPIEPIDTVNPNFCYILQLQCWADPSGYGPFRVKKCKYQDTITHDLQRDEYYITATYRWFCDESDTGSRTEIDQLGQIWGYRITADPACAHK